MSWIRSCAFLGSGPDHRLAAGHPGGDRAGAERDEPGAGPRLAFQRCRASVRIGSLPPARVSGSIVVITQRSHTTIVRNFRLPIRTVGQASFGERLVAVDDDVGPEPHNVQSSLALGPVLRSAGSRPGASGRSASAVIHALSWAIDAWLARSNGPASASERWVAIDAELCPAGAVTGEDIDREEYVVENA